MKKFIICACAGICVALYVVTVLLILQEYGWKAGLMTGLASVSYAGFCMFLKELTKDGDV